MHKPILMNNKQIEPIVFVERWANKFDFLLLKYAMQSLVANKAKAVNGQSTNTRWVNWTSRRRFPHKRISPTHFSPLKRRLEFSKLCKPNRLVTLWNSLWADWFQENLSSTVESQPRHRKSTHAPPHPNPKKTCRPPCNARYLKHRFLEVSPSTDLFENSVPAFSKNKQLTESTWVRLPKLCTGATQFFLSYLNHFAVRQTTQEWTWVSSDSKNLRVSLVSCAPKWQQCGRNEFQMSLPPWTQIWKSTKAENRVGNFHTSELVFFVTGWHARCMTIALPVVLWLDDTYITTPPAMSYMQTYMHAYIHHASHT